MNLACSFARSVWSRPSALSARALHNPRRFSRSFRSPGQVALTKNSSFSSDRLRAVKVRDSTASVRARFELTSEIYGRSKHAAVFQCYRIAFATLATAGLYKYRATPAWCSCERFIFLSLSFSVFLLFPAFFLFLFSFFFEIQSNGWREGERERKDTETAATSIISII